MTSVHEIKSEPLGEEAEGVLDTSNIFFDYEEEDKTPPIKEEIKEEIKTEPLVEDNIEDDESHVIDVENDQEKSDLQAMVDKLLLEKLSLQKDMDKLVELQVENQILKSDKNNLERQLEDKGKKFAELQVENQNLKSAKDYVERQLEDKVKEFKHKVNKLQETLREHLQLNLNLIVQLKKTKKSNVAQNLEIPEEEPVGFPSEDINFSHPDVSSNCSNSGANHVAFEELIIPDSKNDNPEENKKKVAKEYHSTKSNSDIINEKRIPRSTRKLMRYDEDQLDDIISDSGLDKNYYPPKDRTEDETENDEVSDIKDFQEKKKHTTIKIDSKVTPKGKKYQVIKKQDIKCESCGRSFGQKVNLNTHIRTVHDKQRDFKCESCGKSFRQKITLNTHIKTVHDKQRDYKCEICGKSYLQKAHLNIHIKTIHEKLRDYKCESCGKSFGRKEHLNIHIKTVHEKQRDYKCDICGKDFGKKENLRAHIKSIHEKKRKYKCDYCSKRFPRKDYKERHEKTIHNIM